MCYLNRGSRAHRVQIKKDGQAASAIGASKMATGKSFDVIPEVKIRVAT
jgi:hypothetical protein